MADSSRVVDQYLTNLLNNWVIASGDIHGVSVGDFSGLGYGGKAASDVAARAKYYPQPGETYNTWIKRLDADFPGIAGMLTGEYNTNDHKLFHASANNTTQSILGAANQASLGHKPSVDKLRSYLSSNTKLGTKFGWTGNESDEQVLGIAKQLLKDVNTSQQGLNDFRNAAAFADPNNLGEVELVGDAASAGADKASGEEVMRRFAQAMMKPFDQNDPYAQSVIRASSSAADRAAAGRGIRGGLASSAVANAAANAGTAVNMQRNQLGLQALQGAENVRLQDAQMAQNAYNQQYQAQMGQMQQQYEAGKAQSQGMWGTLGGIAGGALGAYFGGPMGASMGFQAGPQLGAGLSGSNYSRPPTLGYNPPTLGYNRGSGLGGNGGGGWGYKGGM